MRLYRLRVVGDASCRGGSVPVKGSKVVTPAFGGENHTYVETRGMRVTDYINTFRDQGS